MNHRRTRTALTLSLAAAYLLAIPSVLSVFPPSVAPRAYVLYSGGQAFLALVAAVSLLCFPRHSPIACVLFPGWKAIESLVAVFLTPASMPSWWPARQLTFSLMWIAVVIFVYASLRLTVANKALQASDAGAPQPER